MPLLPASAHRVHRLGAQMQQDALEVVRKTCDLFYDMYSGIAQAYEG
jgi:hypothetical protein